MSRKLIIQSLAEADLTDAAEWYDRQKPGLGKEFLAEIDIAVTRATEHPLHLPRIRRRPDVRRILLHRFPYRIFFVLTHDAVVVFRVLHSARDDQSWKAHIPSS